MEFLQFQYYEMRKKNKENLPGKWSCCDMVNSIDYMFSVIAWMSIIIIFIIIIIIILCWRWNSYSANKLIKVNVKI